jgi:hypothetical protein
MKSEVQNLALRVSGSGFRVQGLGLRVLAWTYVVPGSCCPRASSPMSLVNNELLKFMPTTPVTTCKVSWSPKIRIRSLGWVDRRQKEGRVLTMPLGT